jgi:hypothetical protein
VASYTPSRIAIIMLRSITIVESIGVDTDSSPSCGISLADTQEGDDNRMANAISEILWINVAILFIPFFAAFCFMLQS